MLTGGLALLSAPTWIKASPKPRPIKPPLLKTGDIVGLVAPASTGDPSSLERARQNILSLGFQVKEGRYLSDSYGYLASTDRNRAADINAMFADQKVKAVFAARGGWGAARMLRYLDWNVIAANPKLLIGYSDVTAIHLAIAAKAGFPTLHGPNAANGWDGKPQRSFKSMAMARELPTFAPLSADDLRPTDDYIDFTMIAPGKAQGRLLGGNLTVMTTLMGSEWIPDMRGAILFLEDVDEAEYRIDRMLTQLREAGILSQISGFIFGQCRTCRKPDEISAFTLPTILQQHIAPLNIPAFYGAHFGHITGQYCLPFGAYVEIDGTAGSIQLLEPIVG